MVKLYGYKWTSQNGEQPDAIWVAFFKNATAKELNLIRKRLLRESEQRAWPPALIEMQTLLREARIERVGLPLPAIAFVQAKRRDWSCAAVYETARRVGLGELLGSAYVAIKPDKEMLGRWQEVYGQVCREVLEGAVFTAPQDSGAPALSQRLSVSDQDRARARPAIDDLRKKLGLKPRGTA